MCYNIEIPAKLEINDFIVQELDNAIRNDEWDEYFHRMSGFTYSKVPVLTTENPEKVQTFNWGLIPKWCKDETQAKEMRTNTLNAKSETIFEKPSFRASIGSKRCLLFAKGFYEWRDYEKKKYPYYIHLKNQPVFTFGGIPLMAEIHNSKMRMPLILTGEEMHKWIDPSISKEATIALMKPYDESLMAAHTISKLITSRTENPNQPKVKEEFAYAELPQLKCA